MTIRDFEDIRVYRQSRIMDNTAIIGNEENWTQEQYRDAVKNFIKEERQGLRNGDTDLNSVNRHNPSIKD